MEHWLLTALDIKVEVVIEFVPTGIVAERYDTCIRLDEQVGKDMATLRLGPYLCMAARGAILLCTSPSSTPFIMPQTCQF